MKLRIDHGTDASHSFIVKVGRTKNAVCDCGWTGPNRATDLECLSDGSEHFLRDVDEWTDEKREQFRRDLSALYQPHPVMKPDYDPFTDCDCNRSLHESCADCEPGYGFD